MKTVFGVARYQKNGDSFDRIGYDEYSITYLMSKKNLHHVRIVVDGFITEQIINLDAPERGLKNKTLLAIKEYKGSGFSNPNKEKKGINIEYLKHYYVERIIRKIQKSLVGPKKEDSRDTLTEHGLI